MAIFGFKKKGNEKLEQGAQAAKSAPDKIQNVGLKNKKSVTTTKTSKAVKANKIAVPTLGTDVATNTASVIIRPRVTEKSGLLSQGGVYTFEVTKNSNKVMVSKAIFALYKVHPVKVAIVNTPTRNVFVKGRKGTVAGIKKAIITVKKGEKIDFV